MINPVISFFKEDILTLKGDRAFFCACLSQCCETRDKALFFENFDTFLQTKISTEYQLTDILYRLGKSRYEQLANKISNIWVMLKLEMRLYKKHKLSTITCGHSTKIERIESIFTPIDIFKSTCQASSFIGEHFQNILSPLTELKSTDGKTKTALRILVHSAVGMGKTVLLQRILHLWATDSNFFNNCIFFTINFDKVESCQDFFDVILDQNFNKSTSITKDLLKYFLTESPIYEDFLPVLFIDQIDIDKLKLKDHLKPFLDILEIEDKIDYPVIAWIGTGEDMRKVGQTFEYIYEIKGFNEAQMVEFFYKHSKNNSKMVQNLMKWLSKERNLYTACSCPLIAYLTAIVYESRQQFSQINGYSIFRCFLKVLVKRYKENFTKVRRQISCASFLNIVLGKELIEGDNIEIGEKMGILIKETGSENLRFLNEKFKEYFAAEYIIFFIRRMRSGKLSTYSKGHFKEKAYELGNIIEKHTNPVKMLNIFKFLQYLDAEVFFIFLSQNLNILEIVETVSDAQRNIIKRKTRQLRQRGEFLSTNVWKIIILFLNIKVTKISLELVNFNLREILQTAKVTLRNYLEEIRIIGGMQGSLTFYIIPEMLFAFKKLKKLCLKHVQLDVEVFGNIVNSTEQSFQLEELSLDDCGIIFTIKNVVIFQFLNKLKTLQLSDCKFLGK
ncbi:unnamed protein product [Dimorphilus gyrociliatus]|uniref:Uncharacterized protein n=1 Tax=Dimorphilus gyrociliatus TaxID=2664684 RepID=A0A7I8WF92_9ANNE|nr:unnamed protein product [Dimorphilus gyrociliatus]